MMSESSHFQNSNFAERGRRIEHFGRLMQNPTVGIDELARAAFDAGLSLHFSITEMAPPTEDEVRDESTESG